MSWARQIGLMAASAMLGISTSSYDVTETSAFDMPNFRIVRRGKNRQHGYSAGCAAHRRWKRARASGINPRVRHG